MQTYSINNGKPKDHHLLNKSHTKPISFATRKWYVINDLNGVNYGGKNNNSPYNIKYETNVLKSNLCDYADAYILVTRTIIITGGNANSRVAFKNCAPFIECVLQINDDHIEATRF